MKVRRLDKNNDYSFGHEDADFISDLEAVKQNIKTKLLLFKEEWWEDQEVGLPLFQSIIGYYNEENVKIAADRLVKERILDVEEVTSVSTLSIEIEDKRLIIQYEVETNLGTVESEVVL